MNQRKKVQRLIKRAKKHVYTVNHSLAQKGVSRATYNEKGEKGPSCGARPTPYPSKN
jgi:hypothetical protein